MIKHICREKIFAAEKGDRIVLARKVVVVAAVAVLLALPLVIASGCAESKQHQADRSLREAISKAQRLMERTVALVANPVYRVGDQYNPMRNKIAGHDIFIAPLGTIHPDALEPLAEAEKLLEKALRENGPDASPADKALAEMTMGRVLALKGYCYSLHVRKAVRGMQRLRGEVESVVHVAKAQAELLGYYAKLSSLGEQDIQDYRNRAADAARNASDALEKIDARVVSLEEEKARQKEIHAELNAQAGTMRAKAQETTGQEGVTVLAAALAIQAKADAAELAVAQIEYDTRLLKSKRQNEQLVKKAADQSISVFDKMLRQRKAQVAENVSSIQGVREELAARGESLKALVVKLAQSCSETAALRDKTVNACELAARRFKQAGRGIEQADVLAMQADLDVLCLGEVAANEALAGSLRDAWPKMVEAPLPAEVEAIVTFMGDIDSVHKNVEQKYTQVAKAYEQAVRKIKDSKYRWTVQGQVGAAYAKLYAFSDDPQVRSEALDKAIEALDNALEGRSESPYLAPVARLRDTLPDGE